MPGGNARRIEPEKGLSTMPSGQIRLAEEPAQPTTHGAVPWPRPETMAAIIAGEQPRWLGRLLLKLVRAVPGLADQILFSGGRLGSRAQAIFQRCLGGQRRARLEGRGMVFYCLTSEKYFLHAGRYEPEVERALAAAPERLGRPVRVAYDLGAHAGYWALALARICGAGGQVFAFEPSPANLARLRENLAANAGLAARITAMNLALGRAAGSARLQERGSMSQVQDATAAGEGGIPVETIALDDFVFPGPWGEHPPPDLILCDIEGHAGQALAGAAAVLGIFQPLLVLEIHDSGEEEAVRAILTGAGYNLERLDGGKHYPYHLHAAAARQPPTAHR